jgi:hypothetical protein
MGRADLSVCFADAGCTIWAAVVIAVACTASYRASIVRMVSANLAVVIADLAVAVAIANLAIIGTSFVCPTATAIYNHFLRCASAFRVQTAHPAHGWAVSGRANAHAFTIVVSGRIGVLTVLLGGSAIVRAGPTAAVIAAAFARAFGSAALVIVTNLCKATAVSIAFQMLAYTSGPIRVACLIDTRAFTAVVGLATAVVVQLAAANLV